MKKLLAILLCLCLLVSLTACPSSPADKPDASTGESTSPVDVPDSPGAVDLYDSAKAALARAAVLEVSITATEVKTFGKERYEQTTHQSVTLSGRSTDHFEALVTETVTQGQTGFTSAEYYDGTTVYMNFDDALYRCDMNAEDYLSRLLPVALLDSALYGKVSSDGSTLIFSDPTAGESWAIYETAVLEDATGTATLSADGTLTATSYTASFRYGAVGMELSVTADISVSENTPLSKNAPADPAAYTTVKYIDAPKMVEMAIAMAEHTNTAVTSGIYFMYDDHSGKYLDAQTSVATFGSGDNLLAKLEKTHELGNGDGVIDAKEESVILRDGVASDGSTTAEDVRDLYLTHFASLLPHGDQLAKAKLTPTGTLILLELEVNDSYIKETFDDLISILQIPDECSYQTKDADLTLSIDIYTGFPVYLSLSYEGEQVLDDNEYSIVFDAQINFDLGSNSAYQTITGEILPDAEPENKATPLFYHVTGSDGEEMWLLGTIHIGDDRTAYLPQQIYDAFDASDALAVEVDIIEFEEQLLTDKKLQTQLSLACLYVNGSTLKDHVSREVYDAAMDTSKAMGIYNESLPYFKAGTLESYISDYFNRHIPQLQSEKGVDYRLLTMAKEQNKSIISIENGLDQMKMFTTCSKALQEYLLMGTIATDGAEYHDDTVALYEAWCSGDEALLRELMSTDTSDLAEEERPLYDEYTKIMETDRNAFMLQKAIEYLQSGDVVFYAVGAAHVMAEDGLVNTLRDAGYTVELVSYEK